MTAPKKSPSRHGSGPKEFDPREHPDFHTREGKEYDPHQQTESKPERDPMPEPRGK